MGAWTDVLCDETPVTSCQFKVIVKINELLTAGGFAKTTLNC
jgi:hypothetical protein